MFDVPSWSLPNGVHAIVTNRSGGVSQAPYASFNLATHVGDAQGAVAQNRQQLMLSAQLPKPPFWLDQQHTDQVIYVNSNQQPSSKNAVVADASWTDQPRQVLSVMTADCLPVLLASHQGDKIAAVHAGWRGLAKGIISKTIKEMNIAPSELTAWIGPAISQAYFEVGGEVKTEFEKVNPRFADAFFQNEQLQASNKYMADLPAIAEMVLKELGVCDINQSQQCTFADETKFYSYRRDGQTGRIASLIWIEP